jgi:hypothetical protein
MCRTARQFQDCSMCELRMKEKAKLEYHLQMSLERELNIRREMEVEHECATCKQRRRSLAKTTNNIPQLIETGVHHQQANPGKQIVLMVCTESCFQLLKRTCVEKKELAPVKIFEMNFQCDESELTSEAGPIGVLQSKSLIK